MSRPRKRSVDSTTVGGRLQAIRLEQGLTQAALAQLSGFSIPTIGAYESNTRRLAGPALLALAEVLKVKPLDIAGSDPAVQELIMTCVVGSLRRKEITLKDATKAGAFLGFTKGKLFQLLEKGKDDA